MNPFRKYLNKEDLLQESIIRYVILQYNVNIIPMNSESRKTPFERFKWGVMGGHKGLLDLFIPIPNGKYNGLFLELKAEGVTIFKKDGTLRKSEHLEIQQKQIDKHLSNGYFATFGIGFENCKKIIDDYMNNLI